MKSSFAEDLPMAGMTAGQYAEATARCKAEDIATQRADADLIIAADTVRRLKNCADCAMQRE
jgi:predicted house-cleaning NTP pyrophosphatase (Maf/HAM1 superfamily)